MRRELKIARTTIHDLEAAVKQYTKRTGGESTDVFAVMMRAPHALVENEMEEKNKVIEMQRFEIKRLRNELESGGSRPSSSSKLQPIPTVESTA